MDQFDGVSAQYKRFVEQDPFRNHLHYPGVLKQLTLRPGDKVLDIGCGDGYFDQLLREKHRARVVGYDSGSRQIDSAKDRKIVEALFEVATPETFTTSEKCNAAVSVLVLPYAENTSHLTVFFKSAFNNTLPGSKFVSAVFNPHFNSFDEEIGSRIFQKLDGLGVKVSFIILPDKKVVLSSRLNQFSQDDYESAAYAAGYFRCQWHNFESNAKGVEIYGADFWRVVHDSKPYQLLVVEKD